MQAPTLLYYETIHALKREGLESFNLGGVPSGPNATGLAYFKSSLGAVETACMQASTPLMRRSPLHLLTRLVCGK